MSDGKCNSVYREEEIAAKAIDWFVRLRSSSITEHERSKFEEWRTEHPDHAKAFLEAEQLWSAVKEPSQTVYAKQKQAEKIGRSFHSIFQRFMTRPVLSSVCLGFGLILIGVGISVTIRNLPFWTSDYHTKWASRKSITLTDNSQVLLNSRSAFSVRFTDARRNIKLHAGEAFFDVVSDKRRPFIVETDFGHVEAIGTSFNVFQQQDCTTVTVETGEVCLVSQGSGKIMNLTEGENASFNANQCFPTKKTNLVRTLCWRQGKLAFDMASLTEVVTELNRYMPERVIIADSSIRNRIVSGVFNCDNPRATLQAMEEILNLVVRNPIPGLIVLFDDKNPSQ